MPVGPPWPITISGGFSPGAARSRRCAAGSRRRARCGAGARVADALRDRQIADVGGSCAIERASTSCAPAVQVDARQFERDGRRAAQQDRCCAGHAQLADFFVGIGDRLVQLAARAWTARQAAHAIVRYRCRRSRRPSGSRTSSRRRLQCGVPNSAARSHSGCTTPPSQRYRFHQPLRSDTKCSTPAGDHSGWQIDSVGAAGDQAAVGPGVPSARRRPATVRCPATACADGPSSARPAARRPATGAARHKSRCPPRGPSRCRRRRGAQRIDRDRRRRRCGLRARRPGARRAVQHEVGIAQRAAFGDSGTGSPPSSITVDAVVGEIREPDAPPSARHRAAAVFVHAGAHVERRRRQFGGPARAGAAGVAAAFAGAAGQPVHVGAVQQHLPDSGDAPAATTAAVIGEGQAPQGAACLRVDSVMVGPGKGSGIISNPASGGNAPVHADGPGMR
jgi:hypothetical protein